MMFYLQNHWFAKHRVILISSNMSLETFNNTL